jgi:hypothetical protein
MTVIHILLLLPVRRLLRVLLLRLSLRLLF